MVDPLNRLQARLRCEPDRERWKPALLQTVAGLAAAMQSTG
jgi:phosphoenolpyruvate carboxylase